MALFVIGVSVVLAILWLAAVRVVGRNNPHPLARRGLILGGIGVALAAAGFCAMALWLIR